MSFYTNNRTQSDNIHIDFNTDDFIQNFAYLFELPPSLLKIVLFPFINTVWRVYNRWGRKIAWWVDCITMFNLLLCSRVINNLGRHCVKNFSAFREDRKSRDFLRPSANAIRNTRESRYVQYVLRTKFYVYYGTVVCNTFSWWVISGDSCLRTPGREERGKRSIIFWNAYDRIWKLKYLLCFTCDK